MRIAGLLVGLVVAGGVAVGAAALAPGAQPTPTTAGAGLLGTGLVGLVVVAFDRAVERRRTAAPFGRWRGCETGLSNADRLAVALGSAAVFVRFGLVHLVADPLRVDGAALTALAVATIGVTVGYRTADGLLDGLRHGALACGLGGALCVTLAAYDVQRVVAVAAFDAAVAGVGVVLPVSFGAFGGLSGAVGWWLADRVAGGDPLA
ncbi:MULTISPECIES: hypothetical protein [Halorussus]|uniref:hypothetical protein n=1 Tax=Halorussus TaxID=1070314 RepID=UPI000E20C983|nr:MULTISPECIES: hypothetical protein [Halorussus]NHN57522.1 hypothetical protein [Halorussus sp. JP-T4]